MESAVATAGHGPSNAVLVLDGEGKVRWASKAAAQLIGATMSELIGRSLGDFTADSEPFANDEAGPLALTCKSGGQVRFTRLSPAGRSHDAAVGAVWTLEPAGSALPASKSARRNSGPGLLTAAGDGAFQLSTDGRYLDVNQAFAEICGYGDLRAFLAAAPTLYVEPARRAELMRKLRQHGGVTHFESAINRRDGTTTWISENIVAVRDAAGRVLHYEGTVHNIGWRKLAEEILNQAEEKWRALVESSGECIAITDRAGLILFSNARARQASIGRPGASIFTEFVPGSQPTLEAAIHRALDRMTAVAITLERANAARTLYEVRVVPIGGAESAPRVILIASDLTERLRAEEAVKEGQRLIGRVADASPAILYVFDFGSERYAYVNHQVEKILGYTSEALLSGGKAFADQLLHPEDAELLAERRRLLVQAKDDNVVFEYTFRMRHANGQWLWMRARDVVFTRTPDGTPAQIIGMAEDVTERRRAGEERERSREQLRALSARLQEAREEESAAISRRVHDELGQALTALSWELTKLTDRLTPTTREMPEVAQRLSSMGGMIDATLQIVRKIAAELRPPDSRSLRAAGRPRVAGQGIPGALPHHLRSRHPRTAHNRRSRDLHRGLPHLSGDPHECRAPRRRDQGPRAIRRELRGLRAHRARQWPRHHRRPEDAIARHSRHEGAGAHLRRFHRDCRSGGKRDHGQRANPTSGRRDCDGAAERDAAAQQLTRR